MKLSLVEGRRKAIGIAARCRARYRFFTSDPAYRKLERLVFKRMRTLAFSVAGLERELVRPRMQLSPARI
ncbi:MAG: hypothetical protein V4472_10710 [Pseudomonadota bacterium]